MDIDPNVLIKPKDFEKQSLQVFAYQYNHNKVYQEFCSYLDKNPDSVNALDEIPFLPIQFFKTHRIQTGNLPVEATFISSGTTGNSSSRHYVSQLKIYENAFTSAFSSYYGEIEEYMVLGLLPSYLERQGSSLIYMVDHFIQKSKYKESGFFLDDFKSLYQLLKHYDGKRKILLIGVSFALLNFIEVFQFNLKSTLVMETGGMKGRRKEMIREELHQHLKKGFGVSQIHSEYGMTELLSQAYSKGDGIFSCPPSMRIFIRDTENPLYLLKNNQTGGINIVDLANIHSISFIATQDLGKQIDENQFEILGRFDHSDLRGCNLLLL